MTFSLQVNIMRACFFFCASESRCTGGWGGWLHEEPGRSGGAEINVDAHDFAGVLFSSEAARPRRQRVDSCCITLLSYRPIKPASRVRNPSVKSAAGSGTRCTRKHFSTPLAAAAERSFT